eukprot:CAMPEP_0184998706 /NCGR_PEP_ID=MMETSP1098-20130426/63190_1 /TAXON_ID=89044 /ORGANISM="Spumella elongata, Strain CCAP 955/1" /LENGTH=130 /DNA_ID=CAMNT_0027525569 /DNA_START=190 /DNA_END=583 /DNA_ORIENTATION=+
MTRRAGTLFTYTSITLTTIAKLIYLHRLMSVFHSMEVVQQQLIGRTRSTTGVGGAATASNCSARCMHHLVTSLATAEAEKSVSDCDNGISTTILPCTRLRNESRCSTGSAAPISLNARRATLHGEEGVSE